MSDSKVKNILVTGGNTGIGFALCKQLLMHTEENCKVYMGVRNITRGEDAINKILSVNPEAENKISLVHLDISDDNSVLCALEQMKNEGVILYALVNNAGIGFQTAKNTSVDVLLNTNFYGVKRVCDAFISILQPIGGRVVNVSSSGAPELLATLKSEERKILYTSSSTAWEELVAAIEHDKTDDTIIGKDGGYCLSKVGVCTYTLQLSMSYKTLMCTSLNPGFINTNMSEGYGAELNPEEGTVSLMKCLFSYEVVSGQYYDSKGVRAVLL